MHNAQIHKPLLVIEPPGGWRALDVRDLWRYRDMIWLTILRDITARYKQTMLGPFWIVALPLLSAGLFSVVFGGLAGLPSDGGVPYALMAYTGTLIWQLFARSFTSASESIAANQHLITKVYYPRLASPIAAAMGGLLDFALGLLVLGILLVLTGIVPSVWTLAALPGLALLAILCGMGLGLWLAALSVRVRDLRYSGTFIVTVGMWVTPVVYSSQLIADAQRIPPQWQGLVQTLFQLNPMYVVVEGFKSVILNQPYTGSIPLAMLSLGIMMLVLVGGMFYFRRVESTVADVI